MCQLPYLRLSGFNVREVNELAETRSSSPHNALHSPSLEKEAFLHTGMVYSFLYGNYLVLLIIMVFPFLYLGVTATTVPSVRRLLMVYFSTLPRARLFKRSSTALGRSSPARATSHTGVGTSAEISASRGQRSLPCLVRKVTQASQCALGCTL